MSVKQIAEAYDQDLETNLSWIKKTFKVDDKAIRFRGKDVNAKIIVFPDLKILSEYNKDTTSDIKTFEQYKEEMWSKIRLFSLWHFHFKHDRIVIGLMKKIDLMPYKYEAGTQKGDFEDYEYMGE